jgi:hypothetical protein
LCPDVISVAVVRGLVGAPLRLGVRLAGAAREFWTEIGENSPLPAAAQNLGPSPGELIQSLGSLARARRSVESANVGDTFLARGLFEDFPARRRSSRHTTGRYASPFRDTNACDEG